jgi:hypothetical protein
MIKTWQELRSEDNWEHDEEYYRAQEISELRTQHAEDVALLREALTTFEESMDFERWTEIADKLRARLEKET